jgi:hypothetical protein
MHSPDLKVAFRYDPPHAAHVEGHGVSHLGKFVRPTEHAVVQMLGLSGSQS